MSILRNTVQRQLILDAVKELDIHATAEQVYEFVTHKHPSISKATVYRNLNQMSQAGELLNIGAFSGRTHYDHRCHEHSHFVCEACSRVFDVESDFSDIVDRVAGHHGFDVRNYQLSFEGLCWDCKSQVNA